MLLQVVVQFLHTGDEDCVQLPKRYLPSGQDVAQAVHGWLPASALKVPTRHGWHVGDVSAVHEPVSSEPDGHDVVQAWQGSAPSEAWNVPAPQALHARFEEPEHDPVISVPAGHEERHALHTVSDDAPQGLATNWFESQTLQAAQTRFASAVQGLASNSPSLHAVHDA